MSELISQSELDLRGSVVSNESLQVQMADCILTGLIEERRRRCDELSRRRDELSWQISGLRRLVEQGGNTREEDERELVIWRRNKEGREETRDEKQEQRNAQLKELGEKTRSRDELKADHEARVARCDKHKQNEADCAKLEREIEQCRSDEGEAAAQLNKMRGETGEETLKLYSLLSHGAARMAEGRNAIVQLTEKMRVIWTKVKPDDLNS